MARRDAYGVYFIFKSLEQGPTYRVSLPKYPSKDPHYRILARQRSRFTQYYFYIRDEALGPMVYRAASILPFQTTYYLNGHSYIEQELKRAGIGFRKRDNAFLAVADPTALQAAADRLSPEIIRRRLDYWTLILGPKYSKKERGGLLRCPRFTKMWYPAPLLRSAMGLQEDTLWRGRVRSPSFSRRFRTRRVARPSCSNGAGRRGSFVRLAAAPARPR
jgi:hypothetical protein